MANIDQKLLSQLSDPNVLKEIQNLLNNRNKRQSTEFAPYYRNKHGYVVKGHALMEKYREDLELKPIYEDEAIKLNLMSKPEKEDVEYVDNQGSFSVGSNLNDPSKEELALLRQQAKALGVPNWQVKGAARLRGDIKKIELNAQSKQNEVESDDNCQTGA